jgi:hypothetical protein
MNAFGIRAILPRPEGRGLSRVMIKELAEKGMSPE